MSNESVDTMTCECCGAILPAICCLEGIDFDADEWERRYADLVVLFKKHNFDEYDDNRIHREAAAIVSIHMYQEWRSSYIDELKSNRDVGVNAPATIIDYVYFIKSANGLIKIGKSNNPERRLRDLITMSPVKLEIIAAISESDATELELHQRFADIRKHGEWFEPTPKLLEYIESLKGRRDDRPTPITNQTQN